MVKTKFQGNKFSIQKRIERSREKSISVRKNTLLKEYQNRFKTGAFIDKRIGEYDSTSLEDKLLERFTKEKQRKIKKSNALYNNPDEEEYGGFILTHKGQEISNLNSKNDLYSDFDDVSDSEHISEDDITLDRETVSKHHFGGFETKSKTEIMHEVISKSKYYKMERQKLSEENNQLRSNLNDTFDNINFLLPITKESNNTTIPNNHTDYDTLVREFSLDTRQAKATNRLKTPSEIALKEQEHLVMLQRQMTKEDSVSTEISQLGSSNEFHLPKKHINETSITVSNLNSLDAIANKLFSTPKSSSSEHSTSDEDIESDTFEFEDYSDNDDIVTNHDDIVTEKFNTNTSLNLADSSILNSSMIFECPSSLEEWNQLTMNKLLCDHDLKLIFSRIKRLYDPSIDKKNTKLLESLVICLFEHLLIVVDNESDKIKNYVNGLIYHIEDIMNSLETDHDNIDIWFSKRLESMLQNYENSKKVSMPERISELIVFHWIGRWYGRSGLSLWNTALLMIGMILQQVSKLDKRDICVGLILVEIYLKHDSRSRLMPEAFGFLHVLIVDCVEYIRNNTSLNATCPKKHILFEWKKNTDAVFPLFSYNIDIIVKILSLLNQMVNNAIRSSWIAFPEVFSPILDTLLYARNHELLSDEASCISINIIESIQSQLEIKREPLQTYKDARPHILPLLNPKIDMDFKKKRKQLSAMNSSDRHKILRRGIKRERKSVIRELRKDTRCIQEEKLKELKQSQRNRHSGQEMRILY